jgi:amidohydrolase
MSAEAIRNAARELAGETRDLRRDFHRHPELAFEEFRTAGIIAAQLEALGLSVRTGVGGTGVTALLDTGRPGRTVLARADIDALPIQQENSVEYASVTPGVMHACGHDGHAAVLLSVARILVQRSEKLTGRVLFIFQPAEETVSGAAAMLADGALAGISADAAIGLHLTSSLPTGFVGVRPGPAMAASDAFRVVIHGHGGHAASPHETVDPVVIAAHVITALQGLVSRETDPLDQSVVSITSIRAGNSFNVIPGEVELKGTLRTFAAATRAHLRERLQAVVAGVATAWRGHAEFEFRHNSPAVVNDAAASAEFAALAAGIVGQEQVVEMAPMMGGDDMALWLQEAPGVYFFVGARNAELAADRPHHHPEFDIDEESLPLAVELLTRGVEQLLAAAEFRD